MQGKSSAHRRRTATDDLAGSLLRASRVLVGVAARSLAEVEGVVTITQFRTLVVLDGRGAHGGLSLARLAGALEVNSSTAHRMVERLLVAGLVTRAPDHDDRRQVLIALSDAGQDVVDRVTIRRRHELAAIARRMPAEKRAAFVEALDAFSAAAGEPEPTSRWDLG